MAMLDFTIGLDKDSTIDIERVKQHIANVQNAFTEAAKAMNKLAFEFSEFKAACENLNLEFVAKEVDEEC